MSRTWIRENPPTWDDDKAAIIGGQPPGIFALEPYKMGATIPGEWWRVEQDDQVVGYGWMDTTWGEGEILLAVAPSHQRHGIGGYILEMLEKEAATAGLNYMHNVVLPTHPDKPGITAWLRKHGFAPEEEGRLRRRVASE